MIIPLFFPHIHLPNPVLLRHQYLYAQGLNRALSSDRPPRDSKEVKQFINETSFPQIVLPTPGDEALIRRLRFALDQSFVKHNEVYIQHTGKFGVERAATKTYHLCRTQEWPDIIQMMMDLGFARIEPSNMWCMSTRMMVQMMATSFVIEYQRAHRVFRCTDEAVYDGLAVVMETLSDRDGGNREIRRAVFEFPYVIPEDLLAIDLGELKSLREEMLLLVEPFQETVQTCAGKLENAGERGGVKEALKEAAGAVEAINERAGQHLKAKGLKPVYAYGEYRWYPSSPSGLASLALESPLAVRGGALHTFTVPVGEESEAAVRAYPGCFVWTRESSSFQGGWWQNVLNWFS